MENVQSFTQPGLFITRFYSKVRKLCQFQNHDYVYNIYIFTSCLFNNYTTKPKKTLKESQKGAWLRCKLDQQRWLFLSEPLEHQGVSLVGHGNKVPPGKEFWGKIHPNNTSPN